MFTIKSFGLKKKNKSSFKFKKGLGGDSAGLCTKMDEITGYFS